jgi:hypothetical protein
VDNTSAFSGAFLITDGQALAESISSGNWVEGGISAFSAAMDTAAMIVDPIGTLIANGLGWLLDHIEPLKGWLEDLTGSASEVQAFAATWNNVATRMDQLGVEANHRLGDLDGLSGETIAAYTAHVQGLSQHLTVSGQWAGAISTGLEMASSLVQMTHDLVRDAISQIVGMAISAAITAVATLGLGAPVVAAQVGTRVAALVPRVGKTITTVVSAFGKLRGLIDELAAMAQKAMRTLTQWAGRTGGSRTVDDAVETVLDTRPYLKPGSRPSYRKGVVDEVWENAKGPDGLVRDPNTNEVIDWTPGSPRDGVWDMGHVPEEKYSEVWKRYVDGDMTPAEFRDWYNNPDNYRPELPGPNRSHRYE